MRDYISLHSSTRHDSLPIQHWNPKVFASVSILHVFLPALQTSSPQPKHK
jgi:hypothetical protein